MEIKCPICGAPLTEGKCVYCGFTDRVAIRKDENENQIFEQEEIGKGQQVINNNILLSDLGILSGVSKKSKTVALLLCIFLGGLGAHRFYVGKGGTGILYLFTGGLCGIGWIIDIFLIVTGSFKDEFGLKLK